MCNTVFGDFEKKQPPQVVTFLTHWTLKSHRVLRSFIPPAFLSPPPRRRTLAAASRRGNPAAKVSTGVNQTRSLRTAGAQQRLRLTIPAMQEVKGGEVSPHGSVERSL